MAVPQFNKVVEWARRPRGQRGGQRLGERASRSRSQEQLNASCIAASGPFPAADAHRDVALQQQFVGVLPGHRPGERNLVAGADSGQVRHPVGQIQRGRLRRCRRSATGQGPAAVLPPARRLAQRAKKPNEFFASYSSPSQSTGAARKWPCARLTANRYSPPQPRAGVVELVILFGEAEAQAIFAAAGTEEGRTGYRGNYGRGQQLAGAGGGSVKLIFYA
jgi:hypothetical protein